MASISDVWSFISLDADNAGDLYSVIDSLIRRFSLISIKNARKTTDRRRGYCFKNIESFACLEIFSCVSRDLLYVVKIVMLFPKN